MNPFTIKDWFNSLFKDKNLRRYVVGVSNDWMIDRNDNDGYIYKERYNMLKEDSIRKCDKCFHVFFKIDIYENTNVSMSKDFKETITKNYYCKKCIQENVSN